MSALYLDSSAFVKTVVEESHSEALRGYLAESRERPLSSVLLHAEALRAVRHLGPVALTAVRDGLRRIDLIAIDDRILDLAGVLAPQVLRTLDALHLASALAVGDDLEAIVTYDERMVAAAGHLGLKAVAPR